HIVTNATGGVCWDSDTLPFGSEAGFTTSCNSSYRFASMERDDENSANLDYAIGRYYDNRLGRFLSVDPTRLSAFIDDPQTWNRYSYAHNNPLGYVDRNGKWPAKIHEQIIDKAFPNLTAGQRQILKDVSEQQDNPFGGGQANSSAFEHAMRAPWQTVEQAEAQYNDFVSGTEDA